MRIEGAVTGAARTGKNAQSDVLSRTHRMTLDEAKMILNTKHDISLEARRAGQITEEIEKELMESYERLFSINAPPAPKGKTGGGSGSFYIQSKVVRARERIEEEWKLLEKMVAEHQQTPPAP
ncbi:hypothetical protein MVES_003377 [Malassezia vespertilionis]|uniref:Mitochondrial import inner membrane translocase subunit TIM16 n=1 Tax=Malassezia vespertilionis TaxID=2020962 RepID=A0A2N1J7L4_9BASI|nr:hypothetical protein MVES_003377 [Malassezia vespertilionis]